MLRKSVFTGQLYDERTAADHLLRVTAELSVRFGNITITIVIENDRAKERRGENY